MPMNIAIKYARLPHGLIYFYQHWIPEHPRALVVFVHGLGDHIGRYGPFISRLSSAGFACALYDQRGHGRSEGRRGHVERFIDWVSDLSGFIQFAQMSVPPETPLFLVGAGLGALVGINYLLTHTAPVDGMVTISADIFPAVEIPEWKRRMARRLARFAPALSMHNGVQLADLTRDEAELSELEHDPFFHRRITLGAAEEIERNHELVMAMPHRIHMPMLMLAGACDRICDPDGTRQFASRLSSNDKCHRLYPEMAHDLLHDLERERVVADIEAWLGQRAALRPRVDRQFPLQGRETLWEDVSPPSS